MMLMKACKIGLRWEPYATLNKIGQNDNNEEAYRFFSNSMISYRGIGRIPLKFREILI